MTPAMVWPATSQLGGVTAGVPGDLLARPAAQVVLEPVAFHGCGVPDPQKATGASRQAVTSVSY
jgi:hypothetical protein